MSSHQNCISKARREVPPYGLWRKEKHWYKICDTLFEVDRKYILIGPIAIEEYDVVCIAITRQTNDIVAIRKISNVFGNITNALRTLRELALLRQIKHQNLIGIKDIMMPTKLNIFDDVYVVYEALETNLCQIMHSRMMSLTNDTCRNLIFQLLRGLNHLHSASIIHRYLDPKNLQVNADLSEVKICYLGLERSNNRQLFMTGLSGVTRWYRAPEQLLLCDTTNNETPSIDIWSVGCILAEILGQKPLFPGTDFANQLKLILTVLGGQKEDDLGFIGSAIVKSLIQSLNSSEGIQFSSMFPHADPLALDLLSKMVVFDPSKRITATEALSHPYISCLNDPNDSPKGKYHVDIDRDESFEESSLRDLMLREILLYHP